MACVSQLFECEAAKGDCLAQVQDIGNGLCSCLTGRSQREPPGDLAGIGFKCALNQLLSGTSFALGQLRPDNGFTVPVNGDLQTHKPSSNMLRTV